MSEKVAPRPKGTAVVRSSKYRHLFGTPFPASECASGVRAGTVQPESNVIKANASFFAVPSGNGTVSVFPMSSKGSLVDFPMIVHEETNVNDVAFHPFNDRLLASACEDGTVALWEIPSGGLTASLNQPKNTIKASDKRVLTADFHPLANDVMYSIDAAKSVKFFDLSTSQEKFALPDVHKALPTNISWNLDGSLCASSCKDKNLRVFDPRSNKVTAEVADHQGAKGGRVLWLGKKDLIFTCGFGKGAERQMALYDPRKLDQRLTLTPIDSSSSSLLPFYDEDNGIVWLAGKGDGNIRYYEIVNEEPYLHFINDFKAKDPQTGVAALPKSCVDVMKCEIMRLLKLQPNGYVVPIKFEVPRVDVAFFQEDLFPDTFDGKSPISSGEWFSGENRNPGLRSQDPSKQ